MPMTTIFIPDNLHKVIKNKGINITKTCKEALEKATGKIIDESTLENLQKKRIDLEEAEKKAFEFQVINERKQEEIRQKEEEIYSDPWWIEMLERSIERPDCINGMLTAIENVKGLNWTREQLTNHAKIAEGKGLLWTKNKRKSSE